MGGCCNPDSPTDCCRGTSGLEFDKATNTCKPPCPCEGCCDYDCCDELDFFLHKAYAEMYAGEYSTFEDFYNDWFQDFYKWWYNGDLKQ